MSERFRHEDIASVPAGWKVRTVTTSGGHRVRVAFPPGRRMKGSGRLVSILHPLSGPNPCGNPCTIRSTNPQELLVMGANPPRRRISDPAVHHQIKIAKDTLRMSDVMARVMGGMSKDEARNILRQYGVKYTESKTNPSSKLDAFTKKHLESWLNRMYLYGSDKRHAKKLILATLKREPGLLAEGKSWNEILRMGEAHYSSNPHELLIMGANPETPRQRRARHTEEWFKALAQGRVVKLPDGTRKMYSTVSAAQASGYPIDVWDPSPADLRLIGRSAEDLARARAAANPRVEVVHGENPPVEDIHEEFTGQEVKWKDIYNEPHMPAGRYAELGPLIALYVKPVKGGQVQRIGAPEAVEHNFPEYWNGKAPIIVTDSTARQIYFVDGCQDVSNLLDIFTGGHVLETQTTNADLYELGQVRRIDYQCLKEHVAHPDEDLWKHNHGEEDGQLPTLFFEARHKRMLYKGGNYRIEGPWIRN